MKEDDKLKSRFSYLILTKRIEWLKQMTSGLLLPKIKTAGAVFCIVSLFPCTASRNSCEGQEIV